MKEEIEGASDCGGPPLGSQQSDPEGWAQGRMGIMRLLDVFRACLAWGLTPFYKSGMLAPSFQEG
jgi:hypothetical protein